MGGSFTLRRPGSDAHRRPSVARASAPRVRCCRLSRTEASPGAWRSRWRRRVAHSAFCICTAAAPLSAPFLEHLRSRRASCALDVDVIRKLPGVWDMQAVPPNRMPCNASPGRSIPPRPHSCALKFCTRRNDARTPSRRARRCLRTRCLTHGQLVRLLGALWPTRCMGRVP
ncbi:hypothetical protein C8R47DRAFT_654952 [Mycena vitilis]|nr:hypothetical protein C8R47DRAFT_654952 [Mycena vitilis]